MSLPADEGPGRENDVRPVVGGRGSQRAIWMFVAGLAVAASILFVALENSRSARARRMATVDAGASGVEIASPPALAIPQGPDDYPVGAIPLYAVPPAMAPASPPRAVYQLPRQPVAARGDPDPENFRGAMLSQQVEPAGAIAPSAPVPSADPFASEGSAGRGNERVQATRFANPSTTVPKGTVVQAVLETALDSTRPGFARAIVSRDVAGFDGTRILIPRGSRLIGEYKADLQIGQKRALIQWQRLTRPDGVIINLDSPSADPLGRAGVEGKVNSHFLARFGGSMLQSALTIGTQVAINKASDGNVIYALPLAGQITPSVAPERVQPTVKVRQGTSVSVFVARDLDFTTVSQ